MLSVASAPWYGPILFRRGAGRRDADCTGAVRCVLAGGDELSLRAIHEATGMRWSIGEIGSVLTKLARRKVIEVIPATPGIRGRKYRTRETCKK